jgi:hypothetical protein
MLALQRWIGRLLEDKGTAIHRTKGVVHAEGGRKSVTPTFTSIL